MTVSETSGRLRCAGIPNFLGEALMILSHFTGLSEASLLAARNEDIILSKSEASAVESALKRRERREPLQYILGTWEFMGLSFNVSDKCLIPRADTELLCETAIEKLPKGGVFLDLCTGSGCIAISVAHYRSDVTVYALEKYPETLNAARENACKILKDRDRIRFILADAVSAADAEKYFLKNSFDFIASNPPYVSEDEMEKTDPELSYEPRHALTDGGDGMSIIRGIAEIYPSYLKHGGILAIEHGAYQGGAIRRIFSERLSEVETLRDMSALERVTLGRS